MTTAKELVAATNAMVTKEVRMVVFMTKKDCDG